MALSLAVKRLLYRAAVFFLMMPQRAERSMMEKVADSASPAPLESFEAISRRIDRIWWRSRDLRSRLITVFRLVCRMRFSDEIVLAILVQITE
jgi:hypothetical protein